jgi:hypothetical protein
MTAETESTAEMQTPIAETQEPVRSGDENWYQTLIAQENTNRLLAEKKQHTIHANSTNRTNQTS